ncbi:hypothetical protein B0H12DRAFT_520441 [Mycena haematopus]|nr:hypothetical protein B0H12DRAFT_520441 [Mycena haematopus]
MRVPLTNEVEAALLHRQAEAESVHVSCLPRCTVDLSARPQGVCGCLPAPEERSLWRHRRMGHRSDCAPSTRNLRRGISPAGGRDFARRSGGRPRWLCNPAATPLPMSLSVERFKVLLHEIEDRMKEITDTSRGSRLLRLNRNERVSQDIKGRLDEAYSDCLAASALRVEALQMQLSVQHKPRSVS